MHVVMAQVNATGDLPPSPLESLSLPNGAREIIVPGEPGKKVQDHGPTLQNYPRCHLLPQILLGVLAFKIFNQQRHLQITTRHKKNQNCKKRSCKTEVRLVYERDSLSHFLLQNPLKRVILWSKKSKILGI